jgi:SAM-dependent MidA family methyltransferase
MATARLPAPDSDAAAHSARVAAHVRAQIAAAGGWIGFDRYMDLVLYAPGLGYYTAGAHKIGAATHGGDFVTAPEISPLFGHALAAQVAQVLRALPAPAHVLEFGAGSGQLARDLLDGLAALGVAARYSIVEVSADLRARQQQLLAGREVTWLDAPPANFVGVVVANEVLDVMPVRVFAKHGDTVLERGVMLADAVGDASAEAAVDAAADAAADAAGDSAAAGARADHAGRARAGSSLNAADEAASGQRAASARALRFADRPAPPELAAAVASIETDVGTLPDGYASEVGLIARAWMFSLATWLARGVVLAIDYGFPRREYYHPQRLMGTIMCHYRHHAHADPLWWPGLNDVTAHVDFTAMAEAAHDAGLDVLGYTTQARFLLNCGLLAQLERAGADAARRAAEAQRLLSEAEMGELFKVLAVGRGIDVPLLGFATGDRLHAL